MEIVIISCYTNKLIHSYGCPFIIARPWFISSIPEERKPDQLFGKQQDNKA